MLSTHSSLTHIPSKNMWVVFSVQSENGRPPIFPLLSRSQNPPKDTWGVKTSTSVSDDLILSTPRKCQGVRRQKFDACIWMRWPACQPRTAKTTWLVSVRQNGGVWRSGVRTCSFVTDREGRRPGWWGEHIDRGTVIDTTPERSVDALPLTLVSPRCLSLSFSSFFAFSISRVIFFAGSSFRCYSICSTVTWGQRPKRKSNLHFSMKIVPGGSMTGKVKWGWPV